MDVFSHLLESPEIGYNGKYGTMQDWFRSITKAYCCNSGRALLHFDIINRCPFQNVLDWLKEAWSHAQAARRHLPTGRHQSGLEAQRLVTQQEAEKLHVLRCLLDAINVA